MLAIRPELAPSKLIDEIRLAASSESAARFFFERQRWGDSPCCPRCGDTAVYRMIGASALARGLWRCRGCRRQFTVTVGTIFESSKLPLMDWCRAMWAATRCKNGISALELKRELQCNYRTALFVLHRIRFAMANVGNGDVRMTGVVEVDECYIGGKPRKPNNTNPYKAPRDPHGWRDNRTPVVAMVQRDGTARAWAVANVRGAELRQIVLANAETSSRLSTDGSPLYTAMGKEFARHWVVRHHIGEYVQQDNPEAHTNSVESFFSRCRRSLDGTYVAVSRKHLPRYLAQFTFTHNTRKLTDGDRLAQLFAQTDGARLKYAEQVGNDA